MAGWYKVCYNWYNLIYSPAYTDFFCSAKRLLGIGGKICYVDARIGALMGKYEKKIMYTFLVSICEFVFFFL